MISLCEFFGSQSLFYRTETEIPELQKRKGSKTPLLIPPPRDPMDDTYAPFYVYCCNCLYFIPI